MGIREKNDIYRIYSRDANCSVCLQPSRQIDHVGNLSAQHYNTNRGAIYCRSTATQEPYTTHPEIGKPVQVPIALTLGVDGIYVIAL